LSLLHFRQHSDSLLIEKVKTVDKEVFKILACHYRCRFIGGITGPDCQGDIVVSDEIREEIQAVALLVGFSMCAILSTSVAVIAIDSASERVARCSAPFESYF